MNKQKQLDLAKYVIQKALSYGADEAKVNVANSRSVEIEYRDQNLDKLSESTQNSLSVSIYVDQKFSNHSTNDLRTETLDRFVEQAVAATRYLTADPFRHLPSPDLYPKNAGIDLEINDANYEQITSEKRQKMAKLVQEAALKQDKRIISVAGGYYDSHFLSTKMHSNGFNGSKEGTSFSVGAEVTIKDGDTRPEDWEYVSIRHLSQLPDLEKIGKTAAKRALDKIGQSKIASGKYSMLVENRAAVRLLSMLIAPIKAQALQQKRSYLDGKKGQKIASPLLNIVDNPLLTKGMASRWYDGEGLLAQKRNIIENGVLQNYYIDTYYGEKLNMQPNGGSTSNVILAPGTLSFDEMVKSMAKGIVVTSFNGGNFNSTTGDYSYGVAGFFVENGIITKSINEMNISGNANSFWNQLVAMGNDTYQYSAYQRPSMLFDDIHFSGL